MTEIHGFSAQDDANIDELARISFNSLDVYGTGKINKAQFKQGFVDFITSAGFGKPSDAFIEDYLRKFDSDHSGDIDFQEYKVYMKDLSIKWSFLLYKALNLLFNL